MLIDFHTHCFPDKIASKAIEKLSFTSGGLTPYTDGTVLGLKDSMKKGGVDASVVLNIATNAHQQHSVNDFAASINDNKTIFSFGSVFPFSEDAFSELERIKELGLKGVKLHPDYQGFFIDDEKTYPIIEYAAKLGLIIVYHAGLDLGIRGQIRCTPLRARKMLRQIGYDKIVLAHMGSHALSGDVMDVLCGENVYFDTSFSLGKMPDSHVYEIIKTHGENKILFGTDCPWDCQKDDVLYFNNLDLTEEVKEKILYKNALELLK